MDVDDVSHIGHVLELLQRQKASLHAASKRKDLLPNDRKPLRQIIDNYMRQYESIKMTRSQMHHQIHQSWVAAPYQPSVTALGNLEKMFIKDLRLETHHRGSYLLLRAAAPAIMMTAVMTIMEDENYDGVVFQLYHQRDDYYRLAEDVVRNIASSLSKNLISK